MSNVDHLRYHSPAALHVLLQTLIHERIASREDKEKNLGKGLSWKECQLKNSEVKSESLTLVTSLLSRIDDALGEITVITSHDMDHWVLVLCLC
jgi:hypothetical protein